MDFSLTPEEQAVADLAATILDDRVDPERLAEIESAGEPRHDPELWRLLAGADLLGLAVGEPAGGLGLGLLAPSLVLEQIGRTLAPVPYGATTPVLDVVARYGTPPQIEGWVRPAISGERIVVPALAEPLNRDHTRPATTASAAGDRWELTGVKTSVPAATIADGLVVTASIDGSPAAFLVDAAAPGVTVRAQETTSREPYGLVELDRVVVDGGAVVGGDHRRGQEVVDQLVLRATLALCAVQLGVTAEALRATAGHARQRVQFDRPIATFQAVGHRLADCYIDVEGVRLTLWQAIHSVESGSSQAALDVQTAKFWAADAGHRVAHAAVHLHGGMGIATSHTTHRYFAFATQIEHSLGGATEQALRIGAQLAAEQP
jgi:acyl-CoA dehydrogenase